ncbi:minor tail protein [Arthrobacter phage BruhMoment]|nr:minor tail protein [Arthrobacter phage BruhMoment]
MPATTVIQSRRGTAAQWTTANPTLAVGEFGYETDTDRLKIGNGSALWNVLPYWDDKSAPAVHTHTASQISDSTAIGRTVLTAADAAAVRTAIGAGTSSLVIGTGAGNAMAGNKTFAFSEITGTLGTNQLPALAINDTFVVADQTAMLALTAQRGDIAIRTDNQKSFILSTDSPGTLADWKELTASGAVLSVAGRTGTVVLTKTDVGLSNVDNTSDVNKPVSTAQQTALNAKENTIAAGTTAQYWRGDKTWQTLNSAAVGLGSVDNTSDANKPVSTATNTALALKANLASPTFTGTVTLPSTTNGLSKSNVGLSNVDNTSDASKPVSTATQTALNGKANTSHTHTSADILTVDGGTP